MKLSGKDTLHVILMSLSRNALLFIALMGNNWMLLVGSMLGYLMLESSINQTYFRLGQESVAKSTIDTTNQ